MTNTKATKHYADLVVAARRLGEELVDDGTFDPEQLRYSIVARDERKLLVPALKAKGLSNRQIARKLGVGPDTVGRDLAEAASANATPNVANATPKAEIVGGLVEDLDAFIAAGYRCGTIYVDPPWLYDNQATRAAMHAEYAGLTVGQLCDYPVGQLAARDAHLHLWTTNAFLFECPRLFAAWGFEFRSSFVWVKPSFGIGNYWRNAHELLLTAIRGDAKRFADKNLNSWLECPRGEHSGKPEQVRDFIERASPAPRIELFARHGAPGWFVWGHQVADSLLSQGLRVVA